MEKRIAIKNSPELNRGRILRVAGEDAIACIPVVVVQLPIVNVPLGVLGIPVDVHDEASEIEDVGVAVGEQWPNFTLRLGFDESGNLPKLDFMLRRQLRLDLTIIGIATEIKARERHFTNWIRVARLRKNPI